VTEDCSFTFTCAQSQL